MSHSYCHYFFSPHSIILIHDESQLYGAETMMIPEFAPFFSSFLILVICIMIISLPYMHDVAYVFLCLFIVFYFQKNLFYLELVKLTNKLWEFREEVCGRLCMFTPSIPSNSVRIKCMESSYLGRRMKSQYEYAFRNRKSWK